MFRTGERVKCNYHKKQGTIQHVDGSMEGYPVRVKFDDNSTEDYTEDGRVLESREDYTLESIETPQSAVDVSSEPSWTAPLSVAVDPAQPGADRTVLRTFPDVVLSPLQEKVQEASKNKILQEGILEDLRIDMQVAKEEFKLASSYDCDVEILFKRADKWLDAKTKVILQQSEVYIAGRELDQAEQELESSKANASGCNVSEDIPF
jgi:hypothetical protein